MTLQFFQERCGRSDHPLHGYLCKDCHGKGYLYSPTLVNRIAERMFRVPFHGELNRDYVRRQVLAALDVLSEEAL